METSSEAWKKEETVLMRGELEKRNLFPNKIKLKSQFITSLFVKKFFRERMLLHSVSYSDLRFALYFCLLISKILCSFILPTSGMVDRSA